VKGNLYFKDIAKLGDGIYASWNDDRVVFYHNDWVGTDSTAYVRILLPVIQAELTYLISCCT
jgi:hypothetical protein